MCQLDLAYMSKCHNVYTSNNFYAGPNKKTEAMLLEVKEDLSGIRQEIKSLKENKTVEKGKPESLSRFKQLNTHKVCFYLAFFCFPHNKRKNCEAWEKITFCIS